MPEQRFEVFGAYPFGGRSSPYAMRSSQLSLNECSKKHRVSVMDSGSSGGNFNHLWMHGLMAGLNKTHTHFMMQASDVHAPAHEGGFTPWLDILIDEMEKYDLAVISAVVAIKDDRGITSCGLGNPKDDWTIWRRFTTQEVEKLPATFDAQDINTAIQNGVIAGDKGTDLSKFPLLHNNQMWVADLRKPFWYELDKQGNFPVYFNFPERIKVLQTPEGPKCIHDRVSEDWFFSRLLHNVGAKTALHHGMKIYHHGEMPYPSWGDWGKCKNGDEETAGTWRTKEIGNGEIPKGGCVEISGTIVRIDADGPVKFRLEQRG